MSIFLLWLKWCGIMALIVGLGVLLGLGLIRVTKYLERRMSPTMALLLPYCIAVVIIYGSWLTYLRLIIPYPEAK